MPRPATINSWTKYSIQSFQTAAHNHLHLAQTTTNKQTRRKAETLSFPAAAVWHTNRFKSTLIILCEQINYIKSVTDVKVIYLIARPRLGCRLERAANEHSTTELQITSTTRLVSYLTQILSYRSTTNKQTEQVNVGLVVAKVSKETGKQTERRQLTCEQWVALLRVVVLW